MQNRSTGTEFGRRLTEAVRERYGPKVQVDCADGNWLFALDLHILGRMVGALKVSEDGWVDGTLRTRARIPAGRRRAAKRAFSKENQQIASSTWILTEDGEVVLRVGGVRLSGDVDGRMKKVTERVLDRLATMDGRIGSLFAPRASERERRSEVLAPGKSPLPRREAPRRGRQHQRS